MHYQKRSGFTMIEILIVLGIIGVFMATVVPKIMNAFGQAKHKNTKIIMNQLKGDILNFSTDIGRVPNAKEGLKVLFEMSGNPNWHGPYSTAKNEDGNPVDGWETKIIYNSPPKINSGKKFKSYELISFGGENRTEEDREHEKEWIIEGN